MQQPIPLILSVTTSINDVFQSFLSGDSKQDAATTSAHRKLIIELLKNRQLIFSDISTIWDNSNDCDYQ